MNDVLMAERCPCARRHETHMVGRGYGRARYRRACRVARARSGPVRREEAASGRGLCPAIHPHSHAMKTIEHCPALNRERRKPHLDGNCELWTPEISYRCYRVVPMPSMGHARVRRLAYDALLSFQQEILVAGQASVRCRLARTMRS